MKKIYTVIVFLITLFFVVGYSFAQGMYPKRYTLQIDSTTLNRSDSSEQIHVTGNQPTDFISIKIDTFWSTGKVPIGYIAVLYGDSSGHWYNQYPYAGPDTLMDTLRVGTWNIRTDHVYAPIKKFIVRGTGGYGVGSDTLVITIGDTQVWK